MTQTDQRVRVARHVAVAVKTAGIGIQNITREKETEAEAGAVIPRRKGRYYLFQGCFGANLVAGESEKNQKKERQERPKRRESRKKRNSVVWLN
jgi:hypothetical protein